MTIPFSQTAPKLQTVLTTGQPTATVIAPQPGTNQQVLAFLSPQKSAINQQVRSLHQACNDTANASIPFFPSKAIFPENKHILSQLIQRTSLLSMQRKVDKVFGVNAVYKLHKMC